MLAGHLARDRLELRRRLAMLRSNPLVDLALDAGVLIREVERFLVSFKHFGERIL
jgi:hypothetical protein